LGYIADWDNFHRQRSVHHIRLIATALIFLAAFAIPLQAQPADPCTGDTLTWPCITHQLKNRIADLLTAQAWDYALAFDYEAAVDTATAAIQINPNDPAAYTLRGQTILLLYEWDRALADFDQALALNPTYADAYFHRGTLYYTLTQRIAALSDLQRYLELAPSGDHAATAQAYVDSIQVELEALGQR
jgi:tetratricopeptide (TPR) repeat protein